MNKEERILKTLKDFGRLPTARLSAICGIPYYYCVEELNKLKEKKLVVEEKETTSTYWSLK